MTFDELKQALKDLVYNNTSGQKDPAITYFGDELGRIIDEFVRTNSVNGLTFKGQYNALTNVPNLDVVPTIVIKNGDAYKVTAAGTFFTQMVQVGALLISTRDNPTLLTHWLVTEDTSTIIIDNQADNRLITATGINNSLYAEDKLTFDNISNLFTVSANARITGTLSVDAIREINGIGVDIEEVIFKDKNVFVTDGYYRAVSGYYESIYDNALQVINNGFNLINTISADDINVIQVSPALAFQSAGWDTTAVASVPSYWRIYSSPINGSAVVNNLLFDYSIDGINWTSGLWLKNNRLGIPGQVLTDIVNEYTLNSGVSVEGVLLKDYTVNINIDNIGNTITQGLFLYNNTVATAGAVNQVPPGIKIKGSFWNGSAAIDKYWRMRTAASTYAEMYWEYSTNNVNWYTGWWMQEGWLIASYGMVSPITQTDRITTTYDQDLVIGLYTTTSTYSMRFGGGYLTMNTWARLNYNAGHPTFYVDHIEELTNGHSTEFFSTVKITQSTTGIGTVAINGTTAVVGTGTQFTRTFKTGASLSPTKDQIVVNGETREVTAVTDDTHLTVGVAFTGSGSYSYTLSGTSGGNRLCFTPSGMLGIGTLDPKAGIDIYFNNIHTEINSIENGAYGFRSNGAFKIGSVYWYNTTGGIYASNGTAELLFDASYNVSIPYILKVDHIGEYTTNHGISFDNRILSLASTTSYAGFNIPHGTAPTSPVNGDMWTVTGGLYIRINGTTVGPLGASTGGDTYKTWHINADSGFTWASSDLVASGTDTVKFVAGSGIAIDTDATNDGIRIRVTGSSGLTSAYVSISDGTNVANASGGDTFILSSGNNRLGIVVSETTNDHATFTINEGNIDHDALANFTQSEHYLQTAITNISTALSTGLVKVTTGTGALSVITDNSSTWNAAQPGHTNLTSLAALTYASLSFVKMSASGTFSLDTTTYLTSVTAHNLLSATHGDTTTGTVARGDIITGQTATPKWTKLALPTTPTNKILTNDGTDIVWSTNALSIGASASVAGSNTGDITLATNHGLSLTNQVIGMGTPSSITTGTTNSVTTTTHTHAITGGIEFIGNGTVQYQIPVTGATPFTPAWTTALNLLGTNGLNALTYTSGTYFVKMTGANTFALDSATYLTSVTLNDIGNPTANKSFTMVSYQLKFLWTNPTPTDGALELEVTGNYTGDVLHIHQNTGTPGVGTDLLHLECTSTNVNPLRINGASNGQIMVLLNPAGTFSYTIYTGAISAARTLTLPAISANDTLAVLGLAQTFTLAQTFRATNAVRVEAASTQDAIILAGRAGGTGSYAITLQPTTLSGNYIVTLPNRALTLDYLTTSTDTTNGYVKGVASKVTFVTTIPKSDLAATIVHTDQVNTYSNYAQYFLTNTLNIYNPAATYYYSFLSSAIAAVRNITLPLMTGDDTMVLLNFAQTLTNKTIAAASNTISGLTNSNLSGTAGITYANIQNVSATSRILGRITAGAGAIEELTGTQATSLLDTFATGSTTKGLVPGSNSVGATYFLNGSGSWAVPAGTYSLPGTVVQTNQANTYGDFAQTFKDNSIRINNPADTFYYIITGNAIGSNRILNIPVITVDDVFMVLYTAQTITGAKTFYADTLVINNATNNYSYNIKSSALAASRDLTLPLLPANDTLMVLGMNQTMTGTLAITGTTKAAGFFYAGTTTPDGGNRLNFDGSIHANGFMSVNGYIGGPQLQILTDTAIYILATSNSVVRMSLQGAVTNGGSAVAYMFDTVNALTTTAKLMSIKNNGTERLYVSQDGFLGMVEITGPSPTPVTGTGYLYVDTADSKIKFKNDAGTVYDLTSAGGTTPVDSTLLDWSTDRYQPYAAAAAGAFDSGTTAPSGTTRMNYGGYFYATQLIAGGSQEYVQLSAGVISVRVGGTERINFNPGVATSGTAIAAFLNTSNNLTTTGDKLLVLSNYGTEKFYVDKDGNVYANGVLLSGSNTYTNATAMPETVHGWEAGTTFSNKTMTEMWGGLLYPYQYPAFTAFTVTGFQSVLECGINFTGGAQTFTWSISNPSNVNTNTVAIRDITNATDLLTSLANDGTEGYTLTAGTQTTNGATRQWGIRATNSKSQQIGYLYLTTTFYSPIFHGVGATGLSVTQLQQLAGKRITGEVSFSAQFTTSNNKIYICYPTAWGDLTSIKDVNLFDITADFTKTTQSFTYQAGYYAGSTMNYNVYEYNNNTTLSNFLIYFNF